MEKEKNGGGSEEELEGSNGNAVLHALVVGFHHKKGCQVEYSYPPLMPDGDSK